MLYLFGWLPAEVPSTPDTSAADDTLPSVTQNETRWAQLGQKLRPQLPHLDEPSLSQQPALSGHLILAQTLERQSANNSPATDSKTLLLQFGDQGQIVASAQTYLQLLGYYRGALDGIFGPLTASAVRNFQQDHDLPVDGVIGPLTWQNLRYRMAATTSQRSTQGPVTVTPSSFSNQIMIASQPELSSPAQNPIFTPGLVPRITFHPLEVSASSGNSRTIWVTVLTLVAVGGVAFYFKADFKTVSAQPTPSAFRPIHRPQPAYPKAIKSKAQVVHQPQPVYPAGFKSSVIKAVASSPTASPNGYEQTGSHKSGQFSAATDETLRVSTETALQEAAQQIPWAQPVLDDHLPGFLYDLQAADSRQQLEGVVAVLPVTQVSPLKRLNSASPTLVRRLGAFPEYNRRSGTPYSYILLDDMGGCFWMNNHELWLTETAIQWLNDNEPYSLTIRRIDDTGRAIDKSFMVQLNTHQMQMAS
jgi:peptidoglycan hydrolase-like protein with peptidoglycan-binding domain